MGRVWLQARRDMFKPAIGIFDSRLNRYWRTLPIRRMWTLLLGIFFITGSIAILAELIGWERLPTWAVFQYAILSGASGVIAFLAIRARRFKLVPIYIALVLVVIVSAKWVPSGPEIAVPASVRVRIAVDAISVLVMTFASYALFLRFINTQGTEQIRIRTQVELAQAMQEALVPPVSYQNHALEAYGVSIPSEEVGGDLVDVISTGSGILAYVADVSGHGIPAGVLMGNLKTALRLSAADGLRLTAALEAINRVLPEVKPQEMYATLACLLFQKAGEVEYSIVGHPPILHYCVKNKEVQICRMEQFPLGLVSHGDYVSATVDCEAGDVFMALSDGVLETQDAAGSEFGFERTRSVLALHGGEPLEAIADSLLNEVAKFGPRKDDQTVLLVRVLQSSTRDLDAR